MWAYEAECFGLEGRLAASEAARAGLEGRLMRLETARAGMEGRLSTAEKKMSAAEQDRMVAAVQLEASRAKADALQRKVGSAFYVLCLSFCDVVQKN